MRLFSTVFTIALAAISFTTQAKVGIAIHGGAGTINKANLTEAQQAAYRAKLKQAVDVGYAVLANGGKSLDAVTIAINVLEDSPFFNAGKGAVYTFDGEHELDASIMDGATRNAGAVAGVKRIKNPIDLAREVMDESVHVMLSGAGAEQFAARQGFEFVDNSSFDTPSRFKALERAKAKINAVEDEQAARDALPKSYLYGTVGAVALDAHGNLAAGTSTGGMTAKRYGRIGDSPVIGAGTWADNDSCAVSATGHGEYFIRYQVAADICARMKYQNKPVEKAAAEVIHDVLLPAGGTGGVIVIDHQGAITMPFNTSGMYRASRSEGEQADVRIWQH
ncbi:isoaspartyl peptidase/L-asparaginase [Neiella marina]|uniref:Isoaspartyl peptidase/L-asparaginase n=1 Tax=Neiella holothuriorum TaxID=2870530 RepID=A0ABS7EBP0_9GAMM|nr:isoaspartyl peptidase/L-asparaginase [Neiella holothuriorum]MBW8189753.1 isoaspartyl peptidase/L-asparaginase [Neiella holothuriorum]